MRKLEQEKWWPKLLAKKDSHSLRELAEEFGATPGAINNALKRNNIVRDAAPPGPRTRRGRPPAPKGSEAEALKPFLDQLGQVDDAEIAGLAGVSVEDVVAAREAAGKAAPKAAPAKKAPKAEPAKAVEAPKPAPVKVEAPKAEPAKAAPKAKKTSAAAVAKAAEKAAVEAPKPVEAPKAVEAPKPVAAAPVAPAVVIPDKPKRGRPTKAVAAAKAAAKAAAEAAAAEAKAAADAQAAADAKAAAEAKAAAKAASSKKKAPKAAPVKAAAPAKVEADDSGAGRSKLTPHLDKLGVVPDAELAKLTGLSITAVRNYRHRKNIPAPSRRASDVAAPVAEPVVAPVVEAPVVEAPAVEAPVVEAPAAAVVEAPAAASLVGARAYRVHLASRAAIVIGSSLVEAAQKAVASGEEVLSIELIGEILA